MADLMSSSAYLDKSHCYNSHAAAAAVYSQSYGSPTAAAHCYYGNMDYLSTSGNSHHSLSVRKHYSTLHTFMYHYICTTYKKRHDFMPRFFSGRNGILAKYVRVYCNFLLASFEGRFGWPGINSVKRSCKKYFSI